MRGCVLLLFINVSLVRAGCPEWSVVCVYRVSFHASIMRACWQKRVSCAAVLRGAGHSGRNVPLIHTCIRGYTLYARKHWRPR